MKQIIEYLGLIIFVIAIILLAFGLLQGGINNTILLVSGILLVVGLVVQVVVGKKYM